jgi:hypothetical protein
MPSSCDPCHSLRSSSDIGEIFHRCHAPQKPPALATRMGSASTSASVKRRRNNISNNKQSRSHLSIHSPPFLRMPCASSGCDSSSICCPPTPPPTFNFAVINGWLADQPVSPRPPHSDRKRARSPFPQAPQPKRRRPLQPTYANMNRRSPRRKDSTEQLSPSRKAQGREHDVLLDEGYVEENAVLGDTATTPKPSRRGRQRGLTQPPLDLAAFSATHRPDNITPSGSYTNALRPPPI